MFSSREEYLAAIRADLARLQGNSVENVNANDDHNHENHSSVTVITTTTGNKTTTVRTTQPHIGNISVNVGCWSGNSRVPDSVHIDGTAITNEVEQDDKTLSPSNTMKR